MLQLRGALMKERVADMPMLAVMSARALLRQEKTYAACAMTTLPRLFDAPRDIYFIRASLLLHAAFSDAAAVFFAMLEICRSFSSSLMIAAGRSYRQNNKYYKAWAMVRRQAVTAAGVIYYAIAAADASRRRDYC